METSTEDMEMVVSVLVLMPIKDTVEAAADDVKIQNMELLVISAKHRKIAD